MAKSITPEELKAIRWRDISIQTLPTGKDVLVLVCESKEDSNRLYELLSENRYGLKVWKKPDGNYGVGIDFIDTDFGLTLETGRNETNYPPVEKLHNKISAITTGIKVTGGKYEVHSQLLKLGELNIEESFRQAKEVHFVVQGKGSPSVVLLVFQDHKQIVEAEADEAFNKLVAMSKGNPVMEISVQGGLMKVRIWDILIDLDVTVEGLKYNPQQLEGFLKETGSSNSFMFALGLPPKPDGTSVIVPTSSKGLETVMVKGYVYTPEK